METSENGVSGASFTYIDIICVLVLTTASFVTRFHVIWNPPSTVFDEIYFGNFTNFYINQTFYHDIHPPLAKLLMFFVAKMGDYKGNINFYDRSTNQIPDYVLLRITPATCSALCIPLVYVSVKFLGFSSSAAFCAATMCLFDISLIVEGRHILTDGILHFFSMLHIAVLCYTITIPFNNSRFIVWHVITGITLGFACSCKNTAWGLMVMDAIAYLHYFWPSWRVSKFSYFFDIFIFGSSLFIINLLVFVGAHAIHFLCLPYDGPGTPYLHNDMKKHLVPKGNLLRQRIESPGLFIRTLKYVKRTHMGNMGIQQFHDSMSFPYNWPVLSGVAVYFYNSNFREIRCLGNVFSYYFALLGIIMCIFPFKSKFRWQAWILAVGYSACYFPFYLIPRVMYQYHYLIPLMIACMGYAAFLDIYLPKKVKGIFVAVTCILCFFGWWLWKSYAYATPQRELTIMLWSRNWIDGDERHKRDRKLDQEKKK